MKPFLTVLLTVVFLGAGGWYGFQKYQTVQTQHAEKARVAAVVAKEAADRAKRVADQAATDAKLRAQQAAADATRKDVEAQLKPMHVSSILPGQPGIVIIDKKEYAEGDQLPLPKGDKRLQIARVSDDHVLLAYNGLTFRLAGPAAPDLDALRKK